LNLEESTMNKIVLAISVLALGVSGANTALLLHMGGKTAEMRQKVDGVAKEIEKVRPLLEGIAEKGALPPGKSPTVPGDPEPKLVPKLPLP
jgi:hypothetical protein